MIEKKLQIKESFKPFIIEKLKLADPMQETLESTYLTADQNETIMKIVKRDGAFEYWEVTPSENGFTFEKKPLKDAEREGLIKRHGVDVTLTQSREVYTLNDATVAFDAIEGLGLFLEIQGETPDVIDPIIRTIGYNEKQFMVKPYNVLVRKNGVTTDTADGA